MSNKLYGGYRLDYMANRVPTYMHDGCPPPHANVPDGSAVAVVLPRAFIRSKSSLQLMSKLALNQLGPGGLSKLYKCSLSFPQLRARRRRL